VQGLGLEDTFFIGPYSVAVCSDHAAAKVVRTDDTGLNPVSPRVTVHIMLTFDQSTQGQPVEG